MAAWSQAGAVIPLRACLDRPTTEVGRKAAVLAWAEAQGLATPGGVVVPSIAFRDALAAAGALGRALYLEQAALRLDPRHALSIAASVAPAVEAPGDLAAAAFAAVDARVAVCRSSAAMEDGRQAAFPGVFASVLGIRSAGRLGQAMTTCWRSAFSAEAVRYVLRMHVEPVDLSLALLVQPQVAAPWYGAYAGVDPLSGAPEPCADLSDAAPDAVVGGAPAVVRSRRAGGRWSGVDRRLAASLEAVHEAAGLLAAHLGAAVDVEFALPAAGDPMILQCRPLTAVGSSAALPGAAGRPCAGGRAVGVAGRPGDIAVLERLTTADYGIVFGHAGVVTEEDASPLGHAAILCRELGVPLVCGVAGTRRLIGRRVVVDGGAGTVEPAADGEDAPAERPRRRRPQVVITEAELALRVLAEGRPGRPAGAEADRLARRTARALGTTVVRSTDRV
ncbi:MAG TPA: PEP/pyruvate-binding domain-containing protein [Acidimicrobiales bacterium]|nr:PEP/pyruvate-binding domain-containing protein [Acidimicrobiales bacterium]